MRGGGTLSNSIGGRRTGMWEDHELLKAGRDCKQCVADHYTGAECLRASMERKACEAQSNKQHILSTGRDQHTIIQTQSVQQTLRYSLDAQAAMESSLYTNEL